jgi:cytosine/adenosine deaminase-related metal-dependent hydrolase
VRLGLLADIHEAADQLRAAVHELRARRVDSFVVLGDILDHGQQVDETVELLRDLPGVGVWGNHDYGLCGEIHPSVRNRFSTSVLDYFAGLQPKIVMNGLSFQHIDPHLDPEQFVDLWQSPTMSERIAGFARCSDKRVFIGHLHGWGVVTPQSQIPWDGNEPFRYQRDERYLTIIHAVSWTDGAPFSTSTKMCSNRFA